MELGSVRFKLYLLILVVALCNGLKTPKHHHRDSLSSGKPGESLELHDLDYADLWGDSYEESGSLENYEDSVEHVLVGSKDKNETKEQDKVVNEESNKKVEESNLTKVDEKQDKIETPTITTLPPTPSTVPTSSEKSKTAKANDSEEDWDWADSDEYYDEEWFWNAAPTSVKKPTQNLTDLPTDNDKDVDKYFNPDKYQDQFILHEIEDLMNREWTVNYPDTNLNCIILRGNIRMIVPVNPTWFNQDYVEFTVPQNAEASGTCLSLNDDYQEILLRWNYTVPGHNHTYTNTIYFGFATNWTSEFSDLSVPADKYALIAVTAAYYNGEINTNNEKADQGLASYSVNDLVEFLTPINQSMSCYKEKSLILRDVQLTFSNIQLEAFRPNVEGKTLGEFSQSVLCDVDEVYVFDAIMTFIIWFWIGALFVVIIIFALLFAMGYRRRRGQDEGGFGYKILQA